MSDWTPGAVLAAAAAWVWVPPGAQQALTEDYHLIAYPEHYVEPTMVAWSRSARPAGELVAEVTAQARAWGRDEVYWWVSDATRPADTEATLRELGATHAETVRVLAYDMTAGLPELDPPADADARIIEDGPALRDYRLVSDEVWHDGRELSPEEFAGEVAGLRRELADRSGFRVVVYLDGAPASIGGCTLAGGAARLWGAGTRPAFRGRGSYRAALARRLQAARQHGMTLALVKGRAQTSSPILLRAGFTAYGEERGYRLGL